jgi:hypothetical protein
VRVVCIFYREVVEGEFALCLLQQVFVGFMQSDPDKLIILMEQFANVV